MGKNRVKRERILQVRIALALEFPNCFVPKGTTKKPLKIGIDKDLYTAARQAYPEMSLTMLRAFLRDYVSGQNYHRCMAEGANRVDLYGAIAGNVDAAAAAFHRGQLKPASDAPASPAPSTSRVGDEHISDLDKSRRIADLRQRISLLEECQLSSAMSNDSYYSDGSKRRDDAEIGSCRQQLKSLEAA